YVRTDNGAAQPWPGRLVWNLALWSLIGTVVVTLIWGIPFVERRLNTQSMVRLNTAGIDTSVLNLRWAYRDVHVHGELPADMSAAQIEEILRGSDGAGQSLLARGIRNIEVSATPVAVESAVITLPEVSPLLSVSLVMQRDTATLDGVVESSEQRRLLVDALLATGVEKILDNLDVSDIDGDTVAVDSRVEVLANMVRAAPIEQVARFFANLDRQSLDYHISTLNRETAGAIENAAGVAIINFDISGEATVAQNAMVSVDVTSDDSTLTLAGQVFSNEQHRRLTFAAREASNGGKQVVDNVSVSNLAAINPGSDSRVEGLADILSQFKNGVSGQIQMRGNDISVQAAVVSDQVKATLQEVSASARGRGITVSESIVVGTGEVEVDPAQALQSKLDELAPQVIENITFNSGNARLTSDAMFTLDLVASVLAEYPALKVEIEGHTDNVGRAATNEELSRDRAASVKQYLVEQSIDAARLVAVGYGSRNPLVSNDTSEGRKRNRRVHFHVPATVLLEQ
ncbi:MAG: OmpA family protein, partial [Pseudomonadota bacterium]